VDGGAVRHPDRRIGLPADGLHARLPRWCARTFSSRDQFANLTAAHWRHELPVLWMTDAHPFDRMPLFDVGDAALWAGDPKVTSQAKTGKQGDA